jgi:phosphatidylglycerophosphate synthase
MFAADVVALGWTAMYCALTTRSPNHASMLTISRIVIAPAVILAAIVVLANVYSYLSAMPGPSLGFYLAWWFGLGLVADLIYGLTARRQLLTRFRHLAWYSKPKTHA